MHKRPPPRVERDDDAKGVEETDAASRSAFGFVAWKLAHDASHPEYSFSKQNRSTPPVFKDSKDAEKWAASAFHAGPSFVQEKKMGA